jgi:4-amino-4-deoxy-L-arabinose transferase-like glycosyltransferase
MRSQLLNKKNILLAGFLLLFWLALLIDLDHMPALWFDEVWNLITARLWVQNGVYGRLLEGNYILSRMMTHSISVTSWQALSFLIFRPGVWQGRLPSTLFMTLALLLLYLLANRMYGKPVGEWSLAVLVMLSLPGIHPYWYGRQAVSEAAVVFYILVGYWFFSRPDAHKSDQALAVLFWGLALNAKGLAIPFLSWALIFPALVAGAEKNWAVVRKYAFTWSGSLAILLALKGLERGLEGGLPEYGLMQGLVRTVALVTEPQVRLETLGFFATIGLLSILGIGYAVWLNWRETFTPSERQPVLRYVRLSWFALVLSWLVWYLLLSIGWLRYYLPAFYLSSVYQALLLLRAATYLRNLKNRLLRVGGMVLGGVVLLLFAALNVFSLSQQLHDRDDALLATISYLHDQTAPDALVESYDAELFFFLKRSYHYPPDQVQLDLNRRAYRYQDIEINYDPLTADPDYIVIGPLGRFWALYADVVTSDEFELVYKNRNYQIYQQASEGDDG